MKKNKKVEKKKDTKKLSLEIVELEQKLTPDGVTEGGRGCNYEGDGYQYFGAEC